MVLLLGWTIFIFKTPAYNEPNVEKIKNNIFMNPKRSYRKRFFWWLYFTMEVQQIVGQRERSECPVTCVTSSWQTLICSWVRCPYSSRVSTRKLHISCVVASHFVSNGSASPGVAQLSLQISTTSDNSTMASKHQHVMPQYSEGLPSSTLGLLEAKSALNKRI